MCTSTYCTAGMAARIALYPAAEHVRLIEREPGVGLHVDRDTVAHPRSTHGQLLHRHHPRDIRRAAADGFDDLRPGHPVHEVLDQLRDRQQRVDEDPELGRPDSALAGFHDYDDVADATWGGRLQRS